MVILVGLHFMMSRPYRAASGIKRMPGVCTHMVLWLVSLVFTVICLLPVIPQSVIGSKYFPAAVVGGLTTTGLALLIVFALKIPSGEERTREDVPTPDRRWKWGFYNNPDDGALFVEKRGGIGYTMNIAHPDAKKVLWSLASWLLLSVAIFLF